MYGIPNMKLAKKEVVGRRLDLMKQAGISFKTNSQIGDGKNGSQDVELLKTDFDAVLLATGATVPRDLPTGRD